MNSCIDLWGESTGLYFFSAIFQGNMALLALVGVFVVFKIQQLSSAIQQTNEIMVRIVRDKISVFYQGLSVPFMYKIENDIIEIFDALKNYLKDHHDAKDTGTVESLEKNEDLINLYNKCKSYAIQKTKLKTEMKLPIILTLFVIIVSLICLPFIHKIHYSWMLLEIYLIAITILLNIVALFLNIKFILKAVKNS